MTRHGLSRRGALVGTTCLFGPCAAAHAAGPPTCTDITAPPKPVLSEADQERHAIFMLLSMTLVFDGWGVDRDRPDLVAAYAAAEPDRHFGAYAGHNIGALLVDANARIVCFALNRNVELNSTLEHAEARAVRTAIHMANAARFQTGGRAWSFGDLLRGNLVYTTLEPCAQCAGIMDLANIGEIIYAQYDPSQNSIVNILYNLRRDARAESPPVPVHAAFLEIAGSLESAYRSFASEAAPGTRTGLTSFLETVAAYRIYRDAAALFETMTVNDAVNTPILQISRDFRARWSDRVYLGGAPE